MNEDALMCGLTETRVYNVQCQGCPCKMLNFDDPYVLVGTMKATGWTYREDSEEGILLFCPSCSMEEKNNADET